jgi:hypothetical protein
MLAAIASVWALVSCSSSHNEKYSMISDSDKVIIKEFCGCVEPIHSILKRMNESKDSTENIVLLDSMTIKLKELKPCLDKVKSIETKSKNNAEFNKQMLAYIKEYDKDCYNFVRDEQKNEK